MSQYTACKTIKKGGAKPSMVSLTMVEVHKQTSLHEVHIDLYISPIVKLKTSAATACRTSTHA